MNFSISCFVEGQEKLATTTEIAPIFSITGPPESYKDSI